MEKILIDLRSDTVTVPTSGMMKAMMEARVGDDVFGDDPTVKALEKKLCDMFGMEAAVFCPSGTMANQIAIKTHTKPGDELICDESAHIYRFEGGGIALHSGCSVRLIQGNRGRFTTEDIKINVNDPFNEHLPHTSLVAIENTSNRGGGSCYDYNELVKMSEWCRQHKLAFHLDGARIFNAITARGESPEQYGRIFDSISVCLSKGLGAPVGSVLLGSKEFIFQARRFRKAFGGGMRQSGYLAAAGIYALEHHINRLADDHRRAARLAQTLAGLSFVEYVLPAETNIVIFKLKDAMPASQFVHSLMESGIAMVGFGPQQIRAVLHLDIDDVQLDTVCNCLMKM